MIAATIVWAIIIEFLFNFRCGIKFSAGWKIVLQNQKSCGSSVARQFGFAVTDVFADLILLVLTMPIVSISVFLY